MVRGILTKLRRAFIINTLLDGTEWHTQEILKKIGDLEYEYFSSLKYEDIIVDNYEIIRPIFRPEIFEPVNNPKLSVILGNLVKDGIIETRALSRFEKEGNIGSRGNVYWLVKSNKALYMILEELNNPSIRYIKPYKIIISEYGKKLINMDLMMDLTEILNPILNDEDKEFILATLRISATALYNLLKAYYKDDYWGGSYWADPSNINYDKRIHLDSKESFLMDLKFWLYKDIQYSPFYLDQDSKIIFDVSVYIKHDNKEFNQDSRMENSYGITYEEFMEEVQYERDHKPKQLVELEDKKIALKRKIYDDLREISEEKGKDKKVKKEKLIREYYEECNNLDKNIKSIAIKYNIPLVNLDLESFEE